MPTLTLLQNKHKELIAQRDTLHKKLVLLHRELASEAGAAIKFQLQYQVDELDRERAALDDDIEQIERQIETRMQASRQQPLVGSARTMSLPLAVLPPRQPEIGFVRRRDKDGKNILEFLITALAPESTQIIALWGAGGTGKTTLAAEAARSLQNTYRGRLIWVDAEKRADFGFSTLLEEIAIQLGQLGAARLTGRRKAEELQGLIAAAPTLIVLDNFEIIPTDEAKRCSDFLERQSPHPALIVTQQKVECATNVLIEAMPPDEANEFLYRLINNAANRQTLTSVDPSSIIAAGGALPLVMRWVVAQIDLAQRPQDVLDELSRGDGDAAQRVFDRSFNLAQVGDDGRAALRALSLFVPGASRAALARVSGFGEDMKRLNEAVMRLAALLLITPADGGERLVIQGLTRALARARLMKDQGVDNFRHRFLTYYLNYAQAHAETTAENFRALESEKDNLLTAANIAYELRQWTGVVNIASALEADGVRGFLPTRGYWEDTLSLIEKTIAAARQLGANDVEAQFVHNKAYVLRHSSADMSEAESLYDESLRLAEQSNNRLLLGLALHEKAALHDGDNSRVLYEKSLEIKRAANDQAGIGRSLFELGKLEELRGHFNDAKRLYEESLEIARRYNDERGAATVLQQMAWLGVGWLNRDNHDEARRLYLEALKIWEKWDDAKNTAYVTRKLGRLEIDSGDHRAGKRLLNKSLKVNRKLKYQLGVSKCLYELGRLAQLERRLPEARRYIKKSLVSGEGVNSRRDTAITLRRLAEIEELDGKYNEAGRLFDEVLCRLQEIKAPGEEVERAVRDAERLKVKSTPHRN